MVIKLRLLRIKKDMVFVMNSTEYNAVRMAIEIIESSTDTNEESVDNTLKVLVNMLSKHEERIRKNRKRVL